MDKNGGMAWATATPDNKGFHYSAMAWMLITAFLVAGFTIGYENLAGDRLRVRIEAEGPQTVAATTAPRRSEAERYRSIEYGGTVWSVTKARLAPRSDDRLSYPVVAIEALVTNTTADTVLRVRRSDISMVWPDGRRDVADRFDDAEDRSVVAIQPGDTASLTVVFEPMVIVDPVLAELTLEIAEPGRTPASMPMVGPVPESAYPILGSIDGEPARWNDETGFGPPLVIEPDSVAVDVNAGAYRAAAGHRLVLIEATVNRSDPSPDAGWLSPGFWRLELGEESLAPARVQLAEASTDGSTRVSLLFIVGESEADMTLAVGARSLDPARFAVALGEGRSG